MSAGNAIESLLDKIDADLSDFLVFAGILDNNAKLLSYRVGKGSFSLPVERHDTLDVQIALMFSLIKQLEDISGSHKLSVTRFANHDIFMFGTSDLHIFVITSPTSEERVAKTLVDLVGKISGNSTIRFENAVTKATSAFAGRAKEQTVSTAMAAPSSAATSKPRSEYQTIERPGSAMRRPRPEAITMLHGYLLGVDIGCAVEEDRDDMYKIKSVDSENGLSWQVLEKISTVFRDKIAIHHIGLDSDGRVFARISAK